MRNQLVLVFLRLSLIQSHRTKHVGYNWVTLGPTIIWYADARDRVTITTDATRHATGSERGRTIRRILPDRPTRQRPTHRSLRSHIVGVSRPGGP
jgi:hypothetical protein